MYLLLGQSMESLRQGCDVLRIVVEPQVWMWCRSGLRPPDCSASTRRTPAAVTHTLEQLLRQAPVARWPPASLVVVRTLLPEMKSYSLFHFVYPQSLLYRRNFST